MDPAGSAEEPALAAGLCVFDIRPLMIATAATSMAMMAFVALIGPIARVVGLAPWQAGATVTVAGVLWMALARSWGSASDRYGRRPILLICVGGFSIAYLALCGAIGFGLERTLSATLVFVALVISRGAVGAFYAGVSATSLALVADHIPPKGRAASMASIGAASAAGLIAGPALAGALAPINLSLPLYATAVLPLAAFVTLWLNLSRTDRQQAPTPSVPVRLHDARLRKPMVVAFIAMLGVAIAQITVGFYALDRLRLRPTEAASVAGIALMAVGTAVILAQLVVRKLDWSPTRLIRTGCFIAALGFGSVALATSAPLLWASYFVAAAGMGLIFPSFSALAANSVEESEQGAAAGSVAMAQGLGMIIGPLAGTLVYAVTPTAPYVLVASLLLACGLLPNGRGSEGLENADDDKRS